MVDWLQLEFTCTISYGNAPQASIKKYMAS